MATRKVLVFLGMMALVLAACGPAATPTPATTPTPRPTPTPAGPTGKLTVAWPGFLFELLDPTQESLGERHAYVAPIYESLLGVKPLEGTHEPALAKSWEASPDGMAWTFRLRDDVKFHNGDPMTAEDVKFSLERWMSKESKGTQAARYRKDVASVEVVDTYTVRVNLTALWPSLPWFISPRGGAEGTIMPKKYVEQVGWEAFEQKPIGTGPFKFSQRQTGTFIEYEAVTQHWRKVPEFKTLRVNIIPEGRTRIALLKNKEVDITEVSVDAVAEVKAAGNDVIFVPKIAATRFHFWGSFLPESGPTYDLKVRKALNLAINRQELGEALLPGAHEVSAFFPSDTSALGWPQDIKPYPYDPVQAKALLAEAGYPNGFPITMLTGQLGSALSAEDARRVTEAIAGYWEKIGVKAKIVPTDMSWLRPRYQADPQKDIVGTAGIFTTTVKDLAIIDAGIFFQFKGGRVRLANNVDDLIAKALKAPTQAELARYTEEVYRTLYNDYRGVPLFYISLPHGVGPRVTNVLYSPGFSSVMMYLEYAKHR